MKSEEEIIRENKLILLGANRIAEQNGVRVDVVIKASLDYVKIAKGMNLNVAEFYSSLNKAKEFVSQSLSKSAIPEITADDANKNQIL